MKTQTFDQKVSRSNIWMQLFINLLENIQCGSMVLMTPDGEELFFEGRKTGINADINIEDWSFCEDIFMKGDIGLGESYIDGKWSSTDISNVIHFGIQNKESLTRVIKGSIHKLLIYRIKHLLNRNTKKGSAKNIHAHYDLGNDFYSLWLDSSMTYSSALFNGEVSRSLFMAQSAKYQKIIDELNLKAGDHVLEIGCGWGGFMEHACRQGIKVTGVTISKEQYDFAKDRLKDIDIADIQLCDYRELDGKFDSIVSIEMFEALGKEYWNKYFSKVHDLLKTNGRALIQSITINHEDYRSYRRGTDFIQQYIFPGGMLPSSRVFKEFSLKNNLLVIDELKFGVDYGKTLNLWEKSFQANLVAVKHLGFDEKFIRTWEFYLKYCEGGFMARKIDVSQFLLNKV